MKVRRPDQSELSVLQQLERTQEQNRNARLNSSQQEAPATNAERIELSLARRIRDELDPKAIENVNKDRIEMIKQKIANGSYAMPSSEVLARSLEQEINLEILTNRMRKDDDE